MPSLPKNAAGENFQSFFREALFVIPYGVATPLFIDFVRARPDSHDDTAD